MAAAAETYAIHFQAFVMQEGKETKKGDGTVYVPRNATFKAVREAIEAKGGWTGAKLVVNGDATGDDVTVSSKLKKRGDTELYGVVANVPEQPKQVLKT